MEIGPWVFILVGFSFPAFVFFSVFRACARVQRPINENPIYAVSAVILAASTIHIIIILILFILSIEPLPEVKILMPVGFDFYRLLSLQGIADQFNVSIPVNEISNQQSLDKIESMICYFLAYTLFNIAFSSISAVICSRGCIYGLWPFRQLFRNYYGGLYELYRGIFYHPVEASIMSKQVVGEERFIVYSGILDEVRLRPSGYIDHIYISAPMKRIVSYKSELDNMKGGNAEFINVDDTEEENYLDNRLQIEGEDISNIFYKRMDDFVFEDNIDYWIGELLDRFINPAKPWLKNH